MSILILLAHCLLPGTTRPLRRCKAIWFGTERASSYRATPFLSLPASFSLFHFLFSSFPAPSLGVAQFEPLVKHSSSEREKEKPNLFFFSLSLSPSSLSLNRPHKKVGKSSSGVCQAVICPCSPLVLCYRDTLFLLKSDTHTLTYLPQTFPITEVAFRGR